MPQPDISRRTALKGGAAAVTGLSVVQIAGPAGAFPAAAPGSVVLPWLDQPEPVPPPARDVVGNLLVWEQLADPITPRDRFFTVKHYDLPRLTAADWRLTVGGRVEHPRTMRLRDLTALPRRSVEYTLECSGNTGLPFFIGGVGNARWAGASLRSVLRQARPRGSELVFWGADKGTVAVRDNSGVTSAGRTGTGTPDAGGGLDLTITEHFARSMSLDEALAPDNLLCYEMNGAPLPAEHGHPVRLIAPGWYGVANVKWLTRIEVTDGRYAGRFMARDYVTIREERRGAETLWTFTTVGRARLKSAPAKVTRRGTHHVIHGAAWGAPVARVEVRIDDGPWHRARLARRRGEYAWRFWTYDWGVPSAGEHTVTCRAFAAGGTAQPSPSAPVVADRRTYWENNGWITRRVRTT